MTPAQISKLKHDLRTTINHIIGYGELLVELAAENGEEDLASRMRNLVTKGRNMPRLVDEILLAACGVAGDSARARRTLHENLEQILEFSISPQNSDITIYERDLDRIKKAAVLLLKFLETRRELTSAAS